MDLEELQKELDRAIQVEDYDRAALIRDEINSREE
jgi:protein-arginine kinase activator protein McsA